MCDVLVRKYSISEREAFKISEFQRVPNLLPPFGSVCLRFTGEEACCFRVVSTASCIKVAWPRVYRRACFSESPPIHRFPGRKRRARNGTERIIKATQPLSTVPRLVRVSGTWLGLDTREIIPRNDETRSNAMFFGEGGHSARFPDCHEPIFLLLFHSSLDRYRFVVPSPAI